MTSVVPSRYWPDNYIMNDQEAFQLIGPHLQSHIDISKISRVSKMDLLTLSCVRGSS